MLFTHKCGQGTMENLGDTLLNETDDFSASDLNSFFSLLKLHHTRQHKYKPLQKIYTNILQLIHFIFCLVFFHLFGVFLIAALSEV